MNTHEKFDKDNPVWTKDDFERAVPTRELLGDKINDLLTRRKQNQEKLPAIGQGLRLQKEWLTTKRLAA